MRTRLAAVLAGAALVVAPSLVLAPPASAAAAVTAPGNGDVVEADRTVDVTATVDARSGASQLQLQDPLGVSRTVDTSAASLQEQDLSYAFDTSCPDYPGAPCSGRMPARNGTWTVRVSGGATASSTFVLRIPPRAPQDVSGSATGPREVVLTWQRGDEPDLTGYQVVDGDGRQVDAVGLGDCTTPTCRHVVAFGSDGPSREVLAVRALRSTCPDCSTTVSSPASDSVTVERPGVPGSGGGDGGGTPGGDPQPSGSPAPGGSGDPSAGPSGGPSAGPSAGASPGASASGGPLVLKDGGSGGSGSVDASGLAFRAFGPSLGLPALPGTPGSATAPQVAPGDGSFGRTLPFGDAPVSAPVVADPSPRERLTGAVGSVLDDERLVRGLAVGLVLLLLVAHLRRWLAATSRA